MALGIITWGSIAAGGYFYGWPYYLRNIKAEWLVDAGGDGDVLTIGEALETAKEGALIEVMPGIYAESLTVARPVVLTGLEVAADGTPAVVVAPETGACLIAGVGPVTVSGFSFRLGGSADAAGTACVDLAAGVTFQGNHVDANGGPALHVGGGADPVVTGNRLAATEAPGTADRHRRGGSVQGQQHRQCRPAGHRRGRCRAVDRIEHGGRHRACRYRI